MARDRKRLVQAGSTYCGTADYDGIMEQAGVELCKSTMLASLFCKISTFGRQYSIGSSVNTPYTIVTARLKKSGITRSNGVFPSCADFAKGTVVTVHFSEDVEAGFNMRLSRILVASCHEKSSREWTVHCARPIQVTLV